MSATDRVDSGIAMPLVASVRPVDVENRLVEVTWAGGNRRGRTDVVDLSPLIDTHRFYRPLRKDPVLFDSVHIVDNGEAIGWGDDAIDMSADSVERLAEEMMTAEDFRSFLARNNLTQERAAVILGRSRRRIASYANEGGIPRIVALACRGYEAGGEIADRIRDQVKQTPPQKDLFDLNAVINEVTVLARNAIMQNGVSVQTSLAEGLFLVHGDRVQLQQVIMNLVLNAIEAMGGSQAAARDLLISTEQDHRGVLVAVRDSGPGIDAAHLENVFDPFYTTKSRGMGMGLSICRSIIETHGGHLWASACRPHGTLFQFTIPARSS